MVYLIDPNAVPANYDELCLLLKDKLSMAQYNAFEQLAVEHTRSEELEHGVEVLECAVQDLQNTVDALQGVIRHARRAT